MNCSFPECENPREGNTLFCASHNFENRKAERESRKVKIVKPMKKVTQKRADELLKYPSLKRQYLTANPICEINLEGCTRKSSEIHHKSLSAKNFLNTDTWAGSCQHCHRLAEDLPAELRRQNGLLTD